MATFNLSVISDEITKDFGHALEVAAREFGLAIEERQLTEHIESGNQLARSRYTGRINPASMAGMKELLQRSGVM
jgi:hypothetical protein